MQNIESGEIGQVFENLANEIGEPVEFELPDWLNKWKPSYTIIRRSIRYISVEIQLFELCTHITCLYIFCARSCFVVINKYVTRYISSTEG